MEKVIYNLVFNRKKQLNAEGKALIQVEGSNGLWSVRMALVKP